MEPIRVSGCVFLWGTQGLVTLPLKLMRPTPPIPGERAGNQVLRLLKTHSSDPDTKGLKGRAGQDCQSSCNMCISLLTSAL